MTMYTRRVEQPSGTPLGATTNTTSCGSPLQCPPFTQTTDPKNGELNIFLHKGPVEGKLGVRLSCGVRVPDLGRIEPLKLEVSEVEAEILEKRAIPYGRQYSIANWVADFCYGLARQVQDLQEEHETNVEIAQNYAKWFREHQDTIDLLDAEAWDEFADALGIRLWSTQKVNDGYDKLGNQFHELLKKAVALL